LVNSSARLGVGMILNNHTQGDRRSWRELVANSQSKYSVPLEACRR
jgi:hypothetical protein